MQKKAFITGITGQDGSYLAELLLEKGYKVHGMVRRSSNLERPRIDHLHQQLLDRNKEPCIEIHYGDLCDASSIRHLLDMIRPDEIYNLGAQSHVKISFEIPEYTADVDAIGTLRLLDAIKDIVPHARYYQASSSEMYGKATDIPLTEKSTFYPRSPYGCAKVFSYWITTNYRESYDLHASNGILFNHESPRRPKNFVSRKITNGLVRIKLGLEENLLLGNLEARRDWGHAQDYVYGMWLMLQQERPDDYVLATNENHTVREFADAAAKELDIDLVWEGHGLRERGIDRKTNKVIIGVSEDYFRPAEVDILQGAYTKAKQKLGWEPKTTFHNLVTIMIRADFEYESKNRQ